MKILERDFGLSLKRDVIISDHDSNTERTEMRMSRRETDRPAWKGMHVEAAGNVTRK